MQTKKKPIAFIIPTAPTDTSTLSNPFQHSLTITPKPLLSNPPTRKPNADSDEDDDLKKPLNFTHIHSTKSSSPHQPSSNHTHTSKSSTASLPHTPKIYHYNNTQSVTQSTSQSMSPSPGVLKNKQNIPSPQRIPTISLRAFHTVNHVEFYKPIPISQSRSTQFEIINETYNDKSIQIKKKHTKNNNISCINILPTAIELKRYETCIITVTCTPLQPMRIMEVIGIEWDLHSIEVHIHAIGFIKNMKYNRYKKRGSRKRSLSNMRQEDNDKCNSVQSSLESSKSNSNSLKNSARMSRRKRRRRRPLLSPTIRREKTFTAAPFASPAPNKIRRNFVFNCGGDSVLSVVQESCIGLTPKQFKKRRVIEKPKNNEIQQFERLCSAVKPIQALFRCYLAQKKCKKLLQCKQRREYYFGVVKAQLMTKRVRNMYLSYKNAAIIIQSSMKTYCMKKKCNEYMYELQQKEAFEREKIRKQQVEILNKERQEQIRLKKERDSLLSQYLMSMIHCKRTRNHYKNIQHSSIVLQSVFKTYISLKNTRQKYNGLILIQSYIRAKLCRYKYLHILKRIKLQKQQENEEKKQCMLWLISLWRIHKFRKKLDEKRRYIALTNDAATFIQSWFIGAMYRRMYIQFIKEEKYRNEAAICIQSWFKGHIYRQKYIEYMRYQYKKKCILSMLSLWRLYKFRDIINEKRRYIAMKNNAGTFIQSWFRGAMYRRRYMEYIREKQDGYVEKVMKMQALMRGKLLRMECYENEELKKIVNKVNIAHTNWKKELTVNYLVDSALTKVTKSRTLYGVSESCDTLCCLLKVVPNISNRIVEHNIIGSLYNVLRNSNRSLPHLNLVNKILNFFLFFAQHDINCYKAIFYRNDTLDILSERLQIHRLDFVLFELTTQLFFVGVNTMYEDQRNNKFLINLRQSDVNRQIRTVQKIMCSKLEIAKRVNKPLRKINNANVKYKIKFQQERILNKCVQNMNKLVDKL